MQTHGLRFDVNCSMLFTELHIQIADVPDRGAPGTDELDFEALFGQIAGQEYPGWVGLEYKPPDAADSSASFGWKTAGDRAGRWGDGFAVG